MTLQEIADRARLPLRRVRYVLDQKVLPGLRGRLQAHLAGRPRSFTALEGFAVACAGLLLAGGVKRQAVIDLLEWLAAMPVPLPGGKGRAARPRPAIQALYAPARPPAEVRVGDGVNVRLRLGSDDTGWVQPGTWAALSADYRPQVVITLDVAELGQRFRIGC